MYIFSYLQINRWKMKIWFEFWKPSILFFLLKSQCDEFGSLFSSVEFSKEEIDHLIRTQSPPCARWPPDFLLILLPILSILLSMPTASSSSLSVSYETADWEESDSEEGFDEAMTNASIPLCEVEEGEALMDNTKQWLESISGIFAVAMICTEWMFTQFSVPSFFTAKKKVGFGTNFETFSAKDFSVV